MQPIRRLTVFAAIAVAALTLVACGGDDDEDTPEDGGTSTAAVTEALGGSESTVEFKLTEFAIDGPATADAGAITFEVENAGTQPHELLIVRSDAAPDSFSVVDAVIPESELDIIGEIDDFDGGEERSATFNLEAGRYLLICNIAAHYELGMVSEFIVE